MHSRNNAGAVARACILNANRLLAVALFFSLAGFVCGARGQNADAERPQDHDLSEADRFKARFQVVEKKLTSTKWEDRQALTGGLEPAGRELVKEFPKQDAAYRYLMEAANRSDAKKALELVKEVLAANPPAGVRKDAERLQRHLEAVGKPLTIKFTAVDGRAVNTADLKSKVVLVDFWATWCGACVADIPSIKATYDKFHEKGFEIVGISLDEDQAKLDRFVADKGMKWPQHFDGKKWENRFALEFSIESAPTMWLVDKQGNLRDVNGRDSLEQKVQKLLAE
jgi:thiol-disulfide isomerase/thioredoxin